MDSKKLLVGFDEAGRGPLAGPVCASAVILPDDFPIELLNDSKKLSEKKRNALEILIKENACYGIALVDHTKIDEINILQASLLAVPDIKIERYRHCVYHGIGNSRMKMGGYFYSLLIRFGI